VLFHDDFIGYEVRVICLEISCSLISRFAKTHENAEDEITQTHVTSVRAKSGRLMVPAVLDVHVYYKHRLRMYQG
jgi:hypothetical protein